MNVEANFFPTIAKNNNTGHSNDTLMTHFIFPEKQLLGRAVTVLWHNSEKNKKPIQALFYLATKLKQ